MAGHFKKLSIFGLGNLGGAHTLPRRVCAGVDRRRRCADWETSAVRILCHDESVQVSIVVDAVLIAWEALSERSRLS